MEAVQLSDPINSQQQSIDGNVLESDMIPIEQPAKLPNDLQLEQIEPELHTTGELGEEILVVDEFESNPTEVNIRCSRTNVVTEGKEIDETAVLEANEDSSGMKSGHKRSASESNTTEITAKRSRSDSPLFQTASDHAADQQANLPTNTTLLEFRSAENELESSQIVVEEKLQSAAISNESTEADNSNSSVGHKSSLQETVANGDADQQSISILADRLVQYQSEVLPVVIDRMYDQLDNMEFLRRGQQLFDQYTSDHPQLESHLKSVLADVLLFVLNHHCGNSVIVKDFCNLLLKIGVKPDDVDFYVDPIASVFDNFGGQFNLDANAKKSALQLLYAIDDEFHMNERKFPGKRRFVEKICGVIRVQLDTLEYDDIMELGWECLSAICSGSRASGIRFFNSDGSILFRRCYHQFGANQPQLVSSMKSMMFTLSCSKSVRQRLMTDGMVQFVWLIWTETMGNRVSSGLSSFFCNFLCDSSTNWLLGPSKEDVQMKLILQMLEWSKRNSSHTVLQTGQAFRDHLKYLWKLWGKSKNRQIRHFCSQIFSNSLYIPQTDWHLDCPTIEDVKLKLWKKKWENTTEVSVSSLIDRFDPTAPAQILPDVILLMRIQLEDVEILMFCHSLINLYKSEQLKQLETPLRRSLMEELLSVVQLHHGDIVVVESFCNLMGKIDVRPGEIDLDSEGIDNLLEIVCDDNLTTTARKSVLKVMEISIGESYVVREDEEHFFRPLLVQKVCRSIRLDLNKVQFDEILNVRWASLRFLCCFCVESRQKFLHAGGISLFKRCYEKFGDQEDLVVQMTVLMKCLLMYNSFRPFLMSVMMADGMLATLWKIWSEANGNAVRCYCCQIFAYFLIDFSIVWPLGHPTRDEVELKSVLLMLDQSESEWLRTSRTDPIKSSLIGLWQLWQFTRVPQISAIYARMFDIFMSDCPAEWPVVSPTKEEVEEKLAVATVAKLLVEDVINICDHN